MKRLISATVLFLLTLALTGCANPGNKKAQNHNAYQGPIQTVQAAVEQFSEDTGVLPIKTFTQKTPLYKRYKIDFERLIPKYLAKPPFNSYLEGGYFQYVIVHPEKNPTVKVLDVTLVSTVQKIERKIARYNYNNGYAPMDGIITKKRYKINFSEIGYENPPKVRSPYSGRPLGFVMNNKLEVFINYLPDIHRALKQTDKSYETGEDVRSVLLINSPYVPVASLPYTVKDGQVVFLKK